MPDDFTDDAQDGLDFAIQPLVEEERAPKPKRKRNTPAPLATAAHAADDGARAEVASKKPDVIVPAPPDVAKLEQRLAILGSEFARRITSLVQSVKIEIVDVTSLQATVNVRETLDALDKEAEDFYNDPKGDKKLYHRLHKLAVGRETAVRKPLADLRTKIQDAIRTFNVADQARAKEQARLAEAQQRGQRLLEAQHEADEHTAAGDDHLADLIIHEAESAPLAPVAIETAADQVDGLHFTRTWHWRYIGGPDNRDETAPALVARARSLMPRDLLVVDESAISRLVKAGKGTWKAPMIEVYYRDDPR